MSELARRLRQAALPDPHDEREVMHAPLLREAADEIERLFREQYNYPSRIDDLDAENQRLRSRLDKCFALLDEPGNEFTVLHGLEELREQWKREGEQSGRDGEVPTQGHMDDESTYRDFEGFEPKGGVGEGQEPLAAGAENVWISRDQYDHPSWRGIPKYHLTDDDGMLLCRHWNFESGVLITMDEAKRRDLALCKRCEALSEQS